MQTIASQSVASGPVLPAAAPRRRTIDPSSARGIRRCYLDALDQSWLQWTSAMGAALARDPYLRVPTFKAFDKQCAKEESLLKRFLPVDEFKVTAGKRRLWAALMLQRERWPDEHLQRGMADPGYGRLVARSMSLPRANDQRVLPVRVSGHAIERVIQRAGVVDLPPGRSDIEAIHASFAGSLIWACAALRVLEDDEESFCSHGLYVLLPVDHGVFTAIPDRDTSDLLVVSYVPNETLWDELKSGVARLRQIGDGAAAVLAAGILSPTLFRQHADPDVCRQILRVWRELRWMIREKKDRPSAFDEAWAHAPGSVS